MRTTQSGHVKTRQCRNNIILQTKIGNCEFRKVNKLKMFRFDLNRKNEIDEKIEFSVRKQMFL